MHDPMDDLDVTVRSWIARYREWDVDLLRIFLGIVLFFRGLYFVNHPERFVNLLQSADLGSGPAAFAVGDFFLAHVIAAAHLVGGLLLTLGLLTRFSALIQLPILIGAVFFVHFDQGAFSGEPDLFFSALVLVALIVIALHGPGLLSLDRWLLRREARDEALEAGRSSSPSPRPV